jgi:hypothetical protein
LVADRVGPRGPCGVRPRGRRAGGRVLLRSLRGADPPTVQPTDPADVSTDVAPADLLRPIEPDHRLEQDRNAFDDPPAGYDPRRFRIEPVPREDRRIREFFEIEPYAPLGWRLGSFIFYSELEVGGGWDSNVFYQPSAQSDWLAEIDSETRLVTDWENHALEFRIRNGIGYYPDLPDQGDQQSTYELLGRIDVRRSTNLEVVAGRDLAREDANAIDAATPGGGRGDETTDRLTLAANHRFNRLSLSLRGGLRETTYDDDPFAAARNFTQRTLTGRAAWTFRPTLAAFAEFGYDRRDREAPALDDGLTRSSDGVRIRLGLSFGQTGEILRGEASVGYGRQHPDTADLPDVEIFLVDANLAWRITPLTSLLLTAETSIDETSVSGASASISRRIGLAVSHAFRRHPIREAGVTYASQEYVGSSLDEHEVEFRERAEYVVDRYWAFFSEARHSWFRSTAPDRDYEATSIRTGVRLRN